MDSVLDAWFTTGRFAETFQRNLARFVGIRPLPRQLGIISQSDCSQALSPHQNSAIVALTQVMKFILSCGLSYHPKSDFQNHLVQSLC